MRVLDLFSGIGGFSLGLERAGMRTVAFCEIDPYCRRVLAKHWPGVPCYGDIRTLTAARLAADGIFKPLADTGQRRRGAADKWQGQQSWRAEIIGTGIDAICGGFPCQDISVAGKGAGIGGERSGLWSEYARIIGELQPRYVIVENVSALLGRGLSTVLGDLAALGYDAEWHCIPASAVGAPHRRDRIWIVAYSTRDGMEKQWLPTERRQLVADTFRISGFSADTALAYSHGGRCEPGRESQGERDNIVPLKGREIRLCERLARQFRHDRCAQWISEPDMGRVAHGVPYRVDRLRALGNAIVPQIAEIIGNAITGTGGKPD